MKKIFLFIVIPLFVAGCQKDEFTQEYEFQHKKKSAVMQVFPEEISLPTGFQPEGIAIGTNQTFYVGSITSGQIYKGNLRTGEGELLAIPSGPDQTVGLSFDKRSRYLYAAKGFSGMGAVYNSETGELVQVLPLADPMSNLINDVVVTSEAVFFTGSLAPILYKVPLMKNGNLPSPATVIPIPLTGDFSMVPIPMIPQLGAFSNGIDTTPNDKYLILANTGRGEIYRVNPVTGETGLIDLQGALLPFCDGILLDGDILYVVQNMLNQVAVIKLNDNFLSGELIATINHPSLGIPTTIAEFGDRLYVVNAHFDIAPPTELFPDVEFEIVKVAKYE
jgi:sugar lactone lactonase YvrE